MLRTLLILICLVLVSGESHSQPRELIISGHGSRSCTEILESYDNKGGVNFRKLQYISWVHGFITSYSYQKNTPIETDWNHALPFIGLYCNKYKNETLLDASIKLIEHLLETKIK
jgi:hypothetical protein